MRGSVSGLAAVTSACCVCVKSDYQQHGDDERLEKEFESATYPGHLSIESPYYEAIFDKACETMEAYRAGNLPEKEVIATLHSLFADNREHFPIDFSDFTNRYLSRATEEFADSLFYWAHNAPGGIGHLFDRGDKPVRFDFLDPYRYGDRQQLNQHADAMLQQARHQ